MEIGDNGGGGGGRVRFNVGGEIFETTTTTLANAGRGSMLGALLDADWNLRRTGGEYFIDRNPACFAVLLDLLRTGALHVPSHLPKKLLYREALYYGLLDHVRAALWGPFDGDRLRFSASVAGHAPGDGTAIRAAPDGGCCVIHGAVAHFYNFLLEERRPVTLDHQHINDALFLDDSAGNVLLLAARERIGRSTPGGGLAAFSAASSEILHRFTVRHAGEPKGFTAGALGSDAASGRVFAGCKGRLNEYGICAWDAVTGEQADFFYEPAGAGCALGDADRLQWLGGAGCLMVATLFPKADDSFIGLVDFRANSVVWSWTDATTTSVEDKRVLHAVAMEDQCAICVVNQYNDLGFLDLRAGRGAVVRWSSRSKLTSWKLPGEEVCYPKLATHGGQLFSSMDDSVMVFSGPEHMLTATLRRSEGGAICDFSIGGGRLFALHNEENVFDVWEAPPPPVI